MSRTEIENGGVSSNPDSDNHQRLCHIVKRSDFDGYGFNLHSEKGKPGQYIGKVDENSPAEQAGLKQGDRIIEVNGFNIGTENHKQVVQRIKAIANEVRLLVIDPELEKKQKTNNNNINNTSSNSNKSAASSNMSTSTSSTITVHSTKVSAQIEKKSTALAVHKSNDDTNDDANDKVSLSGGANKVDGRELSGSSTPIQSHSSKLYNNNSKEINTSINTINTTTTTTATPAIDVTDKKLTKTTTTTTTITETTNGHLNKNGHNDQSISTSSQNGNNQQQTTSVTATDGTMKKGGLNLPMTAAEMRAKLLAKKKYDPKNDSVDLRKKFEIIQKL